jgi:hypothetical protein
MSNFSLTGILEALFSLIGLLCVVATAIIAIIAPMRSASWRGRLRYVLLGSGFGFLAGVSLGAFMLVECPDYRVLPMLFLFGSVLGLLGAAVVFNSLWPSEWRRRRRAMN